MGKVEWKIWRQPNQAKQNKIGKKAASIVCRIQIFKLIIMMIWDNCYYSKADGSQDAPGKKQLNTRRRNRSLAPHFISKFIAPFQFSMPFKCSNVASYRNRNAKKEAILLLPAWKKKYNSRTEKLQRMIFISFLLVSVYKMWLNARSARLLLFNIYKLQYGIV